jgi:VCBS repeat-containing protein
VAIADGYAVGQGASLSVAARGVLLNDTDADSGTASLRAVLDAGPTHATAFTLNADGSFTYTPSAAFSGTDTFSYKANNGSWSRNPSLAMSPDSNVATVSIEVKAAGYGFANVKNLPPADGVTFRPSSRGTYVDFEWKFTSNGIAVNSSDSLPSVTIQLGASGAPVTYTPSTCAAPCAGFAYEAEYKIWDVDWVPKNATPGTYYVIVRSGKSGQRFPETGPGFPVVFKP